MLKHLIQTCNNNRLRNKRDLRKCSLRPNKNDSVFAAVKIWKNTLKTSLNACFVGKVVHVRKGLLLDCLQ